MWKVIQAEEKVEFIKDCLDDKYKYDDIIFIDISAQSKALKVDQASVVDFISDDIVILVEVD